MTKKGWMIFMGMWVFGLGLGCMVDVCAEEGKSKESPLPPEILHALKTTFPKAIIRETETEKEKGLTVYEVKLRQKHHAFEVTLAPDGTILEVETTISLQEVPKPVITTMTKEAEGGTITTVKKQEVFAEIQDGKIQKRTPPRYSYEGKLVKGEMKKGINVAEDGTVLETRKWRPLLPPKALAAVKKAFPQALFVDAKSEKEEGIKRYEAQMTQGQTRMEVEVTPEGVICEIEIEVGKDQVPSNVLEALNKEADGGKIQKISKIEIQAEAKAGKINKLAPPKIVYEAKFTKEETLGEVEVDSEGKVLEKHQW